MNAITFSGAKPTSQGAAEFSFFHAFQAYTKLPINKVPRFEI